MGTAAALRLQHARTVAPLRLQHAPATESRARTPLGHCPAPAAGRRPRGPGPVCAAGVRRVHPSSRRHPSCAAMCPLCRRSTTSPRSFLAPALPRACTGLRGSARALRRVRLHRTMFQRGAVCGKRSNPKPGQKDLDISRWETNTLSTAVLNWLSEEKLTRPFFTQQPVLPILN